MRISMRVTTQRCIRDVVLRWQLLEARGWRRSTVQCDENYQQNIYATLENYTHTDCETTAFWIEERLLDRALASRRAVFDATVDFDLLRTRGTEEAFGCAEATCFLVAAMALTAGVAKESKLWRRECILKTIDVVKALP